MIYKILEKKQKNFTSDNGDEIEYFWYKALRGDGVSLKFGSLNGDHEVEKEVDINLEKTEYIDKKGNLNFRYKEIL